MRKNGFATIGNWIVDYIKDVDRYPEKNHLTIIRQQTKSIGGGAANVIIDLAKMGIDLPFYACGMIGRDSDGDMILSTLKNNGINANLMQYSLAELTSYTDVINSPKEKIRTFFHYPGANIELVSEHIDSIPESIKICYIGYLNMLPGLEKIAEKTFASLVSLRKKGIEIAVDLVSDKDIRSDFVAKALPYIDYLIINEIEAEFISTIKISDFSVDENIKTIIRSASKIIEMGVQKIVAVHCPLFAVAVDSNYKIAIEPSYQIGKDAIKGTVGAGDAFCAGFLYGVYNNLDVNQSLKYANASAWFNLHSPNATEGAATLSQINELIRSKEQYSLTIN